MVLAAAVFAAPGSGAADYSAEMPRVPPKTPAESAAAAVLRPGFRLELVAAEPLLQSPVALAFDEDGRMYVVEYPEYNQYAGKTPHGRGRVRRLEDRDGDGTYETSVVFAADLDMPGAVLCFDGGVFVGAAPDLWYLKDTDGDGSADLRQRLFTGFGTDHSGEGMLNSFHWGPDNRVHISCGLDGGTVRRTDRPGDAGVNVRGQGLAFDARSRDYTLTGGGGQHGMGLDDYGRRFTCGNSDPSFMIMYDSAYLLRNPVVAAPPAALNIAPGGKFTELFRVSKNEPWRELRTRLRTQGVVPGSNEGGKVGGFFTAGTGITIYRGDAFPPEYRGNLFVADVANNIIHRARLEPNGTSFTAVRAEAGVEFFASRDNWCRPVQMANAPDGCLYVIDMYRELIEGAAFLPTDVLKHMDPSGGVDRGRIWRIVPDGFRRPAPPRLSKATTAELVALLGSANGWHRDTAARLLYERRDDLAAMPLRAMSRTGATPQARVHAAYAMASLGRLYEADVLALLADADAHVREHAVRLAERFPVATAVVDKLVNMTDDPAVRVRYQLAYSLGRVPDAVVTAALAKLAARDGGDRWVQLGVLISSAGRAGDLFARLAADAGVRGSPHGRATLVALATQIGAAGKAAELVAVAKAIDALPPADDALAREAVRGLVAGKPTGAGEVLAKGKAAALLADMLREAKATADDEAKPVAAQVAAVRTLGLAPFAEVRKVFAGALAPSRPQPVQSAALEVLAKFDRPDVAGLVLAAWPALSPQVRATATETLFARPAWVAAFLDAVEAGKVARGEVDAARVQLLRAFPEPRVRDRAAKVFAAATPARRAEVVAAYRKALDMKGDAVRGRAVFRKECAACHKLEGFGQAVGADLLAVKDRGAEAVLLNILDPNREVKPQYFSYVLVTDAGQVIAGMIVAETATGVTIHRPDGTSEAVPRNRIEELKSSGLSFMPEGMEKQIDVPTMADLLAYLSSVK
jgi:putative membrane-bound dehydrogenase-like protein